MNLKEYIQELNAQYRTGVAREHSYRPALQQLLASMLPELTVTNEPARIACGAPDYILMRRSDNLPVAFVEAKDIDDGDLDGRRQHREQFERYKSSLSNILFTDYLDFHLYVNGLLAESVRLAEVDSAGKIRLLKSNEESFRALVARMACAEPQRITSAVKLAGQMAAKARLLAETIRLAFGEDNESYENQQLQGQFDAFQRILIHDLTHEGFADIYAQTIAYGMFAARLHDDTPETFSRQEAATLIPQTNPFLRRIFQSIAGYDLDERIAWIVDELALTFRATDIRAIMNAYSGGGKNNDPLMHFYEDFLSAYDPRLRKVKGVWYTPQPVVEFIVRAVDDILRDDFDLPLGLADYGKVERKIALEQSSDRRTADGRKHVVRKFHRVQILDPATGTGTFLAETVRKIREKFAGQEGMWSSYVDENLLPRLNGFELLMASYAIAHLKLDMLLESTGYTPRRDNRLRIYLTNSLEECHPDTGSLFAQWLSNEANEANRLKRDTPVMVMMGNPPYNGESKNKGEWIMGLLADYKKEPGGKQPLNERNPKWINDDYVKFIRMAQHFIEKNGYGVIAFINPHGYLDNPTFRGMRWNLLHTFDKIYTINLHGNSKKKETAPDGSKDENVFDIMQGVSINLFVKLGSAGQTVAAQDTSEGEGGAACSVRSFDLYGTRQHKYEYLSTHSIRDVAWEELKPKAPFYFFVPKDFDLEKHYREGFAINELCPINSVGIVTTKDDFLYCDTKDEVRRRMKDLIELPEDELRGKYGLKDTRDWSVARAKADVGDQIDENKIQAVNYRPFLQKYTYYTGKTNGIAARPRFHCMKHVEGGKNISIVAARQCASDWRYVFLSQYICDLNLTGTAGRYGAGYVFPLYKIPDSAGNMFDEATLVPNFNPEIVAKIERGLGRHVEPQELFDYIYAVLHSPTYRERYKEFLKIDFPRVPYPVDTERFEALAEKGGALRRLHLMEDAGGWAVSVTFPVAGTNVVQEVRYDEGRVFINPAQYFGGVGETAWNFFIGGYQPAQKWLKDRKGQTLTFDDITHYQRIIYALDGTERLMREIDAL